MKNHNDTQFSAQHVAIGIQTCLKI